MAPLKRRSDDSRITRVSSHETHLLQSYPTVIEPGFYRIQKPGENNRRHRGRYMASASGRKALPDRYSRKSLTENDIRVLCFQCFRPRSPIISRLIETDGSLGNAAEILDLQSQRARCRHTRLLRPAVTLCTSR